MSFFKWNKNFPHLPTVSRMTEMLKSLLGLCLWSLVNCSDRTWWGEYKKGRRKKAKKKKKKSALNRHVTYSVILLSICVCVCVCAWFTSRVWIFVTLLDCSPPGSSVHGIFQARILKWVVISFSSGSSLNLGLLHWQADSLSLSHQGKHIITQNFKNR